MSRLPGERLLKRVDGLGRLALFIVTLAGVHQPGKFIAARRLPPKPEDKKKREQHAREGDKKIGWDAALGVIGTAGLHAARLAQRPARARLSLVVRHAFSRGDFSRHFQVDWRPLECHTTTHGETESPERGCRVASSCGNLASLPRPDRDLP